MVGDDRQGLHRHPGQPARHDHDLAQTIRKVRGAAELHAAGNLHQFHAPAGIAGAQLCQHKVGIRLLGQDLRQRLRRHRRRGREHHRLGDSQQFLGRERFLGGRGNAIDMRGSADMQRALGLDHLHRIRANFCRSSLRQTDLTRFGLCQGLHHRGGRSLRYRLRGHFRHGLRGQFQRRFGGLPWRNRVTHPFASSSCRSGFSPSGAVSSPPRRTSIGPKSCS